MSPLVTNLAEYPWQLFATLTFKTEEVPKCRRLSMVRAVVRQQARIWGIHFDAVRWVFRGEMGEATQRFHWHGLIAGLPLRAVTTRNCLALCSQWEGMGGGMARVRTYVGGFEGAAYVLKGLSSSLSVGVRSRMDDYELGKFGGQCIVTLSGSLLRDLRYRFRGGRFHAASSPYECETDTLQTPSTNSESVVIGKGATLPGANGLRPSVSLTGGAVGIASFGDIVDSDTLQRPASHGAVNVNAPVQDRETCASS